MTLTRNEAILQTYGGSRALLFLCDYTSLSIDQLNFISCQIIALFLSFLLKGWIKTPLTRLWYCMVCGTALCYFCFGNQIFHIISSAAISYFLIRSTHKSASMPWLVLTASISYLSFMHVKRQFFEEASYALDITGPLMVLTQKLTSLAFSIRDGHDAKKDGKERPATELQKRYAVSDIPDLKTYASFVFQFQSMLAGPLVLFRDFTDFIHAQDSPSPIGVVLRKFAASMFFAFLFLKVGPQFDVQVVRDKDFYDGASFLYKIFYITIGTTLERCKYYHAWILADAVCNASGLGYDRVKNTWDLVSNVDAFNFETGTNLKESLDLWNMGTMKWLRHVVYERCPPAYGTGLVYVASAIWHGFYPGYYITFLTGALYTYAARSVRRTIRPYFIVSAGPKMFYDFITWLATRVAIAYATFSFVIQDFYPSWNMYIRLYFCMHVLSFLALFVLPPLFKSIVGSSTHRRTVPTSNGGLNNAQSVKQNGLSVTQSESSALKNGTAKLANGRPNDKSQSLGAMNGTEKQMFPNEIQDKSKEFDTDGITKESHNEDEWKNLVMSTGMPGAGSAKLKTG